MNRTVTITVCICARSAVEATRKSRLTLALFDPIARGVGRILWPSNDPVATARGFRREQRRRLRIAAELAKDDPRIDVQIVTMDDGACRTVVRRLGGWGCTCGKLEHAQIVSGHRGAAAGPQQQPPLVGAGAGASLTASADSGETPTAIAGSGAEDMEGVGVAPAPTGPSAASGDSPHEHQRRSDQ